MKLVKGILVTFIVTGILSTLGVNAGGMAYADVRLPAFSGIYDGGQADKTSGGSQSLYTIDARDAWNFNDTRIVQARTRSMFGTTVYSPWTDVIIGGTIYMSDNYDDIGAYKLQLRAKKSTLSETRYWGSWRTQ